MDEIKLDVQVRSQIGSRKIKQLRRDGSVPAVVYGGSRGPTPIQVERRNYEKIMRQHKGQSVVFHLNVMEGEKKIRDYSVILKNEQLDPVLDNLVHIDFQRISLKQEIEVKVPVVTKGEAVGVKQDGGSLDQPMRELDVVTLPTNIPESIEIDITDLNIGDSVHVSDIKLPEGVKTNHDPESLILSVVPPMKEEEEAPAEGEEELTEPEVTKEKKDEGEPEAEAGQEKAEEAPKEEKSE